MRRTSERVSEAVGGLRGREIGETAGEGREGGGEDTEGGEDSGQWGVELFFSASCWAVQWPSSVSDSVSLSPHYPVHPLWPLHSQ